MANMWKYDRELTFNECLLILANPASMAKIIVDGLDFISEFKNLMKKGRE
ncbi:hypothetical protein NBO_6g0074 [Nosema bombycis CQ1]|uniref:Uncharacterized protein n=1 Tax=Nosema bombycis (strain CQ1 / CVCC 102059) TaxID=578461 RepID=R0MR16_NOSB1|nr:hypothetical protein NBO_6g0074 [Nosema bombycis CQ1]|eukprot:EOB15323.1 hypothetical protein NBO_6g0074 [Nosema bombycis CQ1]